MKKGNTILIQIKTGYDLRDAEKVEVIFSQAGNIMLVKTGDDLFINEKNIQIIMTKEENRLFESGRFIPVEICAYYEEGTMLSSNVMYRPFNGTLKGDNHECEFRKCKCHCDRP